MYTICTFSSLDDINDCYDFMKSQASITGYVTKYNLNEFLGIEPMETDKYIGWSREDVLNMRFTTNSEDYTHTLRISDPRPLANLKAPTIQNDNVKLHTAICKELTDLYERKNHDYGDAFHDTLHILGFKRSDNL